MKEKVEQLAEKHGWKGLSERDNFRNALRMIGDAMLCETLHMEPNGPLAGAAVALSLLASGGGSRVVPISGTSLETIMYKAALGAHNQLRQRCYDNQAFTALCMIAGYSGVKLERDLARELRLYGKEEESGPAGDA